MHRSPVNPGRQTHVNEVKKGVCWASGVELGREEFEGVVVLREGEMGEGRQAPPGPQEGLQASISPKTSSISQNLSHDTTTSPSNANSEEID